MNKKRILYIESNPDGTIGGSYYSLLFLIEGLNKDLYEPYVLFCHENVLISRFKEVAKEVLVSDYDPFDSNPFNSWKTIPRFVKYIVMKQPELKRIIRNVKPDLVHLNNTYAANHEWVLACLLNNIKVVAHDRGTRPPATWQTKIFSRFVDAIIPVSDVYAEFVVQQGLKPKLIRRVYNGLDAKTFKKYCTPETRITLREELGANSGTILVGMVGNIDYWKGQLVFVKAMDAIIQDADHCFDVQGIIIGDTPKRAKPYEQQIRNFIRERNIERKVKFLGFRQDIPQILNAMDIFVHASVEPEPFGRVILEAMVMGKPIVATKPGGPCEIIDDGVTGYLIPMNDHVSMKNAIMKYVKDLNRAKSMGEAAQKAAEAKFSVTRMVGGVEAVYEEIFNSSLCKKRN